MGESARARRSQQGNGMARGAPGVAKATATCMSRSRARYPARAHSARPVQLGWTHKHRRHGEGAQGSPAVPCGITLSLYARCLYECCAPPTMVTVPALPHGCLSSQANTLGYTMRYYDASIWDETGEGAHGGRGWAKAWQVPRYSTTKSDTKTVCTRSV